MADCVLRFYGTLGAEDFVFGKHENPAMEFDGDVIAEDLILTDNPDECDHFIDGVIVAKNFIGSD